MHAPHDQTPDAPATPETMETPDPPETVTPGDSVTPVTSEPTAEPRPQPKSAYELPSKKNTVLRNMLWALALTMAVVIVIGIAFFGVGSNNDREPLENSALDVAESAERAQQVAGFPVAAPLPAEGWSERSARFTDGDSPRWQVEYTSPQDSLVTLTEEAEVSAPMVSSALPGTVVEEELDIEGTPCQILSGGEGGAAKLGVSCQGEDFGLLVHGDTDREELLTLTEAALTDMRESARS